MYGAKNWGHASIAVVHCNCLKVVNNTINGIWEHLLVSCPKSASFSIDHYSSWQVTGITIWKWSWCRYKCSIHVILQVLLQYLPHTGTDSYRWKTEVLVCSMSSPDTILKTSFLSIDCVAHPSKMLMIQQGESYYFIFLENPCPLHKK